MYVSLLSIINEVGRMHIYCSIRFHPSLCGRRRGTFYPFLVKPSFLHLVTSKIELLRRPRLPLHDHPIRPTDQLLGHCHRRRPILPPPARPLSLDPTPWHPHLHRRHGTPTGERSHPGHERGAGVQPNKRGPIRSSGRDVLRSRQPDARVSGVAAALVRSAGPTGLLGDVDQRHPSGHLRPPHDPARRLDPRDRRLPDGLHVVSVPLLQPLAHPLPAGVGGLLQHLPPYGELLGRGGGHSCVWLVHPLDVPHCLCLDHDRPFCLLSG